MSKYKPQDFLDVLPDGFVTTHDIADAVGCTPETANRHLYDLAHEGKVQFNVPPRKRSNSRDHIVKRVADGEDPLLPPEEDDPREVYDQTP